MTKTKRLSAISLLLVIAAGAAALQVHETRLSSGYAPILRTAMTGSFEQRAAYVHQARMAVRTAKDREVEADLEKMQKHFALEMPPFCKGLQGIVVDKQDNVEANQGGQPEAYAVVVADNAPFKDNDAVQACIAAEEKAKRGQGGRLWKELRATAGVSVK
jgi:hypothetical protein